MANYLDLIKTIYTKQKIEITEDQGMCIALTRTLAKNPDNLSIVKNLLDYLFYIQPKHYFYLLYFSIAKKNYIPSSIKIEIKEEKENKIYERIKYIFGWSNKELLKNRQILDKVITDKKFWHEELGVKNEKY